MGSNNIKNHQINTSYIYSAIFYSYSRSPSMPSFIPLYSSSSENNPSSQFWMLGYGIRGEECIQGSLLLPFFSCTRLDFLPTVDLHLSLKCSRVLEVEVRLNFFLVLLTSPSSGFVSSPEFFMFFDSHIARNILSQVELIFSFLFSDSFIVKLLLISYLKVSRPTLSSRGCTEQLPSFFL